MIILSLVTHNLHQKIIFTELLVKYVKIMLYFSGSYTYMQNKSRPKYLGLFALASKMSITAKVSILHRISGVFLFIAIPFILFVLHQSLTSATAYDALYGFITNPVIKLIYLVLIWAFLHHMCAGVRFLFLDIDKGVEIKRAKLTARLVLGVSIILTVIFGVIVW